MDQIGLSIDEIKIAYADARLEIVALRKVIARLQTENASLKDSLDKATSSLLGSADDADETA